MQERKAALFRRILVPLDGSGLAERALEPAIRIAQADSAELVLLRIADLKDMQLTEGGVYSYLRWNELVERNQQEAIDYLERVQQTKVPRAVPACTLVLDGDEAGTIVDTAASEGVDLIIMSTHGRSGLSRWILGSVTEKVLRAAPCPVLVIRPESRLAAPSQSRLARRLDGPRVLITLDGSELAEQALAPGLGAGCAFDAEVILLRVNELLEVVDEHFVNELERAEHGLGDLYRFGRYQFADRYLEAAAGAILRAGMKVKTAVIEGPVAQSILGFADGEDIDLIVIATHGRTGLRRWVYGSVAEKVLRGAHCAVMVVRPPADQLN